MDFLDALRVLVRRWYLVLAGLLLMSAASGAAIILVPTGYQASGQYLLMLLPESTGEKNPTNPLLNVQPGLTVTASLIAGNLTTKDAERSMARDGFDSDYAIGLSPDVGPLLVITADDTDPDQAVATRDELLRRLDAELASIQVKFDIPPAQFIYADTNAVSESAEAVPGRKIKALAVIAAVGTLLTLVTTFGLDRLLVARRRKKSGDAGDPSAPARAAEPIENRKAKLSTRNDEDRSGVARIARARPEAR
jgi:hypothetical protein